MERKKVPEDTQAKVLIASRRRCAICFALNGDFQVKKGQIAHVDRDPSNTQFEDLAYLCLEHHDEYDSKTSQSKGLTKDELIAYRKMLYDFIEQSPPIGSLEQAAEARPKKETRAVMEPRVYEQRINIYRTAKSFIGKIVREGHIGLPEASKFASDTDEVLFMFDRSIDEYFAQLFKRAVRLYSLDLLLDNEPVGDRRSNLVNERFDILEWFTDQPAELRNRLYRFVNLQNT